jgi:hypothetical protein
MTTELPILFSGPMVRAILNGSKTQTRRTLNPQPISNGFGNPGAYTGFEIPCHCDAYPPSAMLWPDENGGMLNGDAGHPWLGVDQLWVKETFSAHGAFKDSGRKVYRADIADGKEPNGLRWKPSIFCSRKASRISLEIVDVEAERLISISKEDAIAEGIEPVVFNGETLWNNYEFKPHTKGHHVAAFGDPRESYRSLWQFINGPGNWDKNPFVWKISFKRIP